MDGAHVERPTAVIGNHKIVKNKRNCSIKSDQCTQKLLNSVRVLCVCFGVQDGASANPEERAAFEKMLTAVGGGMRLVEATTSELQQTLPEFTARYRQFNAYQDIHLDFPDDIPVAPDPVPSSLEEVRALMGKLCSRLNNCRK